jgi:hypothetical protein
MFHVPVWPTDFWLLTTASPPSRCGLQNLENKGAAEKLPGKILQVKDLHVKA